MAEEAEQQTSLTLPQKVEIIENGKPISPSSIDNYDGFMQFLMLASINAQLTKVRRYFDDRTPQGYTIGYDVAATDRLQELELHQKAQAVSFINTGPAAVDIWVNSLSYSPRRLRVNVPLNINFETHVISSLWFRSLPGLTSAVEVIARF